MTWALVVYRKASYDKIQIAGLFLFVGFFIMEFAISLYRKYSTAQEILGIEIATSFISPFTYAVTISVLYIFIFELNRIRIVLQGVDFERKYKQLRIIRAAIIALTFLAMVLILFYNINSNLSENDQLFSAEVGEALAATSGIIKLIVDIYIYWNLSVSIKYLYQ